MGHDRQTAADHTRPIDLSGGARKRLVEALLAAFDRAGFEQLARFHLNEDFEEIAAGGNLRQMAFSLVEWAADHGRLPDLVAGALAENPSNADLRAFDRDVWARALAGDPAVLAPGGEAAPDPGAGGRRPKVSTPVIAAALAVAAAIAGVAWLALANRPGGDPVARPEVTLSNASLSARTVGNAGEDVVEIGFRVDMQGYQDSSVVVEAVALDAETLQPIVFSNPPSPQRFSPDLPSEAARGTIRVPFTRSSQCIVARLLAYDGNDYPRQKVEVARTETPVFDAWNPANPSCPRAAA